MSVPDYRGLIVWQKSIQLAKKIYNLTKKFPKEELFGLTNQLRRDAVSIFSNIAEGNGRLSRKEYLHFLSIARGSKSEVEAQLLFCVELGYLQESEIKLAMELCTEVSNCLTNLFQNLKNRRIFKCHLKPLP